MRWVAATPHSRGAAGTRAETRVSVRCDTTDTICSAPPANTSARSPSSASVLDRARHRELLERDAVAADPRQRDRAVEGEDQALAGDAAQRAQPGHRGGRDLGEAGQLEHAQAIAVRDHQVCAEQRRRRRVHGDRAGRGDLERDRVEHGRTPAAQGHQGATVGGRGDDGDAGAHESFAASASSASSSKLIAVARARSASV